MLCSAVLRACGHGPLTGGDLLLCSVVGDWTSLTQPLAANSIWEGLKLSDTSAVLISAVDCHWSRFSSNMYPQYYADNTFHHQRDGWLSSRCVKHAQPGFAVLYNVLLPSIS